jgi:protein-tyrosine-phosphatase
VLKQKSQRELTKEDRVKVMFIDEMNSLQSQIAEYFLNKLYGNVYVGYSAGARFDYIDCELISVMYQNGHDIRASRAKDFRSKQMPTEFDHIFFLEKATYDRIKDIIPYDAPQYLKDFGDRSDLKASDDLELYNAYTELINKVCDWVRETFADPEELKGKQ